MKADFKKKAGPWTLSDFLDPEYCPVSFLLEETRAEPRLEDIVEALLATSMHQYALQQWVNLVGAERPNKRIA